MISPEGLADYADSYCRKERNKTVHFQVGNKVKVMLPPGESTGTNTVKHFQGKASVIKAVRINRKGKSLLGYSYTLLGCKTKWGIDYEFCEEWLVPLDEGVEA